jgi:hypothetical protein
VLCINGFAVDFNRHGIASAGAANQERTIMLLSTMQWSAAPRAASPPTQS